MVIPALEVRGLEVGFGPVPVCSGVNLDLPEGAVGALVGANGAGKSTVLRALAGVNPARGQIRLFGEELSGLSPRQRVQRGLVLAAGGRGTFPSLTIEEGLGVGVLGGRRRTATAARVDEACSLFPVLAGKRRQRCGTLSAGEQQLVTLARALLARPRVLLVDELALGLAETVAEDVGRQLAERGSVLVVDQSIVRVLGLASWAWFLVRGTVAFSGPSQQLARRDDLLSPVLLG
jgi:branched-chain amino acid transport system ATP-binding protein